MKRRRYTNNWGTSIAAVEIYIIDIKRCEYFSFSYATNLNRYIIAHITSNAAI
jgi:hypothetical protein